MNVFVGWKYENLTLRQRRKPYNDENDDERAKEKRKKRVAIILEGFCFIPEYERVIRVQYF